MTAKTRTLCGSLLVSFLLGSALPGVCLAAEEALVLRLQGQKAAAEERCVEALELLGRARAADPSDVAAVFASGQCQIELHRYADAVSTFESVKQLDPNLVEADLYLGMARYHMEDLDGAETALQAALESLPERAEIHLYLGLIALERGEAAEAAQSLARAGMTDPGAVEPIASFYEGLAREDTANRRKAEAALRRAQELGKGTVWEDQAATALERLGSGRQPPWKTLSARELEVLKERSQPWWIIVTAGFEWDSNVGLRTDDVHFAQYPDAEDDGRFVYALEAGYELFASRDWTIGVLGTHYATAHFSEQEFDTHYPGISLWLDRRLNEDTIGRFQYDFSYDFVGDPWIGNAHKFLMAHTWTPAVYKDWGEEWGNSRFFSRFVKRDFFFKREDVPDGFGTPYEDCPSLDDPFCGPPGLNERHRRNRDGWGFSPGLDHAVPMRDGEVVLRGGYRFHYYDADGPDFDFHGNEVQLGARFLLPAEFAFEVFGGYTRRAYHHFSSYPDPDDVEFKKEYPLSSKDRRDDVGRVDVVLERPILDDLIVSARYHYLNNGSNVTVFDYDRHIVGLYATVRFAP
jgi:tetratricopeptide (TPR) repeat protein